MKITKSARFLSALLSLALIVCSLPLALGLTASAESTTADYSGLANKTELKISDYSELGMHDGAGLQVYGGALVTDKVWYSQLKADIKASGAYAVYAVTPGTDFTATFTATTNLDKIKIYASEDLVDWFIVEPTSGDNTLTLTAPDYAAYVKIQWPASDSWNNGLVSVSYTAAEKAATLRKINYGTVAPTFEEEDLLGNGDENDTVSADLGVWDTSDTLFYYSSGVIQPDWFYLDEATEEAPYEGYVVYKVQPGTHFGLTVTGDREASVIASALGYENPLDWNVKIYGSLDGETYTLIDTEPVYGARYANNSGIDDDGGVTRRSADYNFIVPEDVVFIKCVFPQTKNLAGLTDADGNEIYEWTGNDLFEINSVEFTNIVYDYNKVYDYDYAIGDSYTRGTALKLTADNIAELGISGYNGTLVRYGENGPIDTDWSYQWNNSGKADASITYAIEPGTPFYIGFDTLNQGQKEGYVAGKPNFTLKVTAYNDSTGVWVGLDNLVITEDNLDQWFYTYALTAEENIYSKITFQWPTSVSGTYVGNSVIGISDVYYTPAAPKAIATREYNFLDDTKGNIATVNDTAVHAVDWSKSHVIWKNAQGLAGDWSYLWERAEAGEKPYVTWEVYEGQQVDFEFWQTEKYIEFYGNIKVFTSNTIDFAESTEYSIVKNSDNNYSCRLVVPEGHYYVKVLLPQDRYYSTSVAGNDHFRISKMTVTLPAREYDFTSMGNGAVTDLNDAYVRAVEWSQEHPLRVTGNGLAGDWSYLWQRVEAGQKPYAIWKAEAGQQITLDLFSDETYLGHYDNTKVYTSATQDFAEATEYELTHGGTDSYSCRVIVPTGHNYIKVELPTNRRYSESVAGNDRYTIKKMTVEYPVESTGEVEVEKTVTAMSAAVSEGAVCGYKTDIGTAGIVLEITYSDGETRKTDVGYTYTGFDASVLGDQEVTVTYKGLTDTVTVTVDYATGDLTADGDVSILDLIRLKKIAANDGATDGASADIDGDGEAAKSGDLTVLKQMILGVIA